MRSINLLLLLLLYLVAFCPLLLQSQYYLYRILFVFACICLNLLYMQTFMGLLCE